MAIYPLIFEVVSQSNGEGNGRDTGMSDAYQGPWSAGADFPAFGIWHNTAAAWQDLEHDKGGPGTTRNNLTTIGNIFDSEDDAPDLGPFPVDVGSTGYPIGGLTIPEAGPQIGPEMTLGYLLRQHFRDVNKVFFFKYCVGHTIVGTHGSGVQTWKPSEAELYDNMVSRWTAARAAALTQFSGDVTGFDLRGVFSLIGESDGAGGSASPQEDNPANYFRNMREVIETFRDDTTFQNDHVTYTFGSDSTNPVPWIQPMIHPGIDVTSVEPNPTPGGIETVRAAQLKLANEVLGFRTFEVSDWAVFEIDWLGYPDNHYGAPTQEEMGKRLASALITYESEVAEAA